MPTLLEVPNVSIQLPEAPEVPVAAIRNDGTVVLSEFDSDAANAAEVKGEVIARLATSSDDLLPAEGRSITHELPSFDSLRLGEGDAPMQQVTHRIQHRQELEFHALIMSRTDDVQPATNDLGLKSRGWLTSTLQLFAADQFAKQLTVPAFAAALSDSQSRQELAEQYQQASIAIQRISAGEPLPAGDCESLVTVAQSAASFEASLGNGQAIALGRVREIATEGQGTSFANRQPLSNGPKTVPVTEGEMSQLILQTRRQLILLHPGDLTFDQYAERVKALRNRMQEQLQTALIRACEKEAEIARPYRDFDELALQAAGSDMEPKPIKVLNTNTSRLLSNPQLVKAVQRELPSRNAFDLSNCVAFIVATDDLKSPNEAALGGKLALRSRAIFVGQAVSTLGEAEVGGEFEAGGRWSNLNGVRSKEDEWKRYVYLTTNAPANKYGQFTQRPLPVSCAGMAVGKMIANDSTRCLPPAGEKAAYSLKTMDDFKFSRQVLDPESLQDVANTVNTFVKRTANDLVLWGVRLLSGEQVNVMRCLQAMERQLSECLMQKLFQPTTPEGQKKLKDELDRYLRNNSGSGDDKMFLGGKVVSITLAPDPKSGIPAPNRCRLEVKLGLKYVNEFMEVVVNDATIEYFLDQLPSGWAISEAKAA